MIMKWVRIVFWNLWFYLEWNTKMSTQFNHTLAIRITTMWIQSTFKVISTFDLIVDWLVSLIGVVRILMLLKSDMSWNTTLIHTRRLSSRYLNTTPPKIKITTLNFIWFTFLVSRWFVDLWFILARNWIFEIWNFWNKFQNSENCQNKPPLNIEHIQYPYIYIGTRNLYWY